MVKRKSLSSLIESRELAVKPRQTTLVLESDADASFSNCVCKSHGTCFLPNLREMDSRAIHTVDNTHQCTDNLEEYPSATANHPVSECQPPFSLSCQLLGNPTNKEDPHCKTTSVIELNNDETVFNTRSEENCTSQSTRSNIQEDLDNYLPTSKETCVPVNNAVHEEGSEDLTNNLIYHKTETMETVDQLMDRSGPLKPSGEDEDGCVAPGEVLENSQQEEAWNSEELADVSRGLRARSKQVRRMIRSAIRKRQMEEETLEAFKKRLKKLL